MKKGLALMLGIILMFSLTACGTKTSQPEEIETAGSDGLTMTEEATADTELETSEPNEESAKENSGNILIVYFSRWGNTEYPDDVDATTSASIVIDGENYGTTEYVARMIQENVGGDLQLIQTQVPYPSDFDELRDLNHSEMEEGYLPALVESNLDISQYDTVFIGYPVWATEVPQAVLSFLNEYDLSGKTVIPFCTHDGYGAGGSYGTIREASHAAESPEGLAIEAKDISSAENTVSAWLEEIGITRENIGAENAETEETAIKITIGDIVLDGVIYDTALAQEIKEYFPLTISMSNFGGREYYGGVDFYPAEENLAGGGNTFDNGDITYCEAHHNMAVFYAQTDDPVLSVDVIPIGRVTSDLSVFENLDSREEITFSLVE